MGLIKDTNNRLSSITIKSDKVIWILVMIFAMVSVLAIFSASSSLAVPDEVSKLKYFKSQLLFAAGGIAVLVFCYFIPLRCYRILAIFIYAASLALLAYSIATGKEVNGAQRTVKILGVSFQALEFAKIGLIFYLAKALEMWKDSLNTFKDFCLKLLLPIGITCALVLPNSASSVILFGGLSLLILFLMGINWKYIAITVLGASALLAILVGIYNVAFKDKEPVDKEEKPNLVEKAFNRFGTSQKRIENFIKYDIREEKLSSLKGDKEEYQRKLDDIRQSQNAKVAIMEGGIIGKGPGKGTARYGLSEAFSDLIYAFIVNEYGLLGGIGIIFLYMLFLFRGIRIAQKCSTPFSQTLALGITWLIAVQAILHILVNVRLLPITGHTLPFISQGGTAFIIFSAAVGVLLSVSKQINKQEASVSAAGGEISSDDSENERIEEDEEIESDN